MTTRSKTRKASAADLKKIAALDFEPLKDSKEEALRYFDLDAINNPYLVNCRMASMVMIKSKPELIEMADLVTEMTLIKHPFKSGVKPQKGVEF